MNKRLVFVILLLTSSIGLAEEKLGQTGFQFLSVSPDARAAGMGGAMTTADWGSGALFFNPAGMANMDKRFDFAVSRNRWIADINHDAFSIAIKPPFASIGVFGISVQAVDYGAIEGTMVWANEIGYIETGLQEPTALAVGFGYARAISDRFSVGGQVKVASQYLGDNTLPAGDELVSTKNLATATAYDFGTIFRTGFRSLTFGMSIRNFSNEIKFEQESFQLPLTFRLGLAMNLFELLSLPEGGQSLLLRVDAAHPRSFSEQVNTGIEYSFYNFLFVRGGYLANYDERGLTFGFGVNTFGLRVDYAYWPVSRLGDVQRFTLRFGI